MRYPKLKTIMILTLIFSFPLFSFLYSADVGKISGTVMDKRTGKGLAGANVIIKSKWENGEKYSVDIPMGAATDENGKFFILNVPPGEYDIMVSFIGYRSVIRERVKVFPDKTTFVDFLMEREVLKGEAVVVVSEKVDVVDKDLTATRSNYEMGVIQNQAGIDNVSDVLSLQADVESGHFRGGREGEADFFIENGSILNPLNNSQAFNPIAVALEQVQVYTSGFSAEYGNVQSGVVNMIMKEGSKNRWNTTLSIKSDIGNEKVFGGNVYSEEYNKYFKLLNNTQVWADSADPATGSPLWSYFGIRFPDNYMPEEEWSGFPPRKVRPNRNDTLRIANLMRILWLQSIHHMGMSFNTPHYIVETATGGPVLENVTMFLAGQVDIDQPFLPTPWPDRGYQLMGNIVYSDLKQKIKLMFNYDYNFENDITSNYRRWFEEILDVSKYVRNTYQVGINYKLVLSSSSYFEANLNHLNIKDKTTIDVLGDDQYLSYYNESLNWRHYTAPTGYATGRILSARDNSHVKTYYLSTRLNSQIDVYNFISAGLQFKYYDLYVYNKSDASSENTYKEDVYHKYPYEGAIFIQDKIELNGMIGNIGLRYDFYNFNTEYYADKFSPYRVEGTTNVINKEEAKKEKTKFTSLLEPRIGLSFPISEKSVLYLNYGVFLQRPLFERIYTNVITVNKTEPNYYELGNPRLKPMRTISYDMGISRILPGGFNLNVSAYLKDVSNLIQYSYYEDVNGYFYYTFDNREYADVKGFYVSLEKSYGDISGYVKYNYESDKGKAAEDIGGGGARSRYYEADPGLTVQNPPEDIYLDYNRLHRIVASLNLLIPDGIKLIGGTNVNVTYRFLSGRPFTYDEKGLGLRMNKRTPNEHRLNFRIAKTFEIDNVKATFFFEGYNMLNYMVFNYDRVFGSMQGGEFVERYVKYESGEISLEEFLTDNDFYPFITSLDAYLISNQPRHYRVGITFNF